MSQNSLATGRESQWAVIGVNVFSFERRAPQSHKEGPGHSSAHKLTPQDSEANLRIEFRKDQRHMLKERLFMKQQQKDETYSKGVKYQNFPLNY